LSLIALIFNAHPGIVVTHEMTDDATWICRDQLVGNQRTLMTDS